MTDAYRRTRVRDGVTLNYRTLEMLTVVDRALSFPITLTQGSYNTGTAQSAGTHDGGGALDVRAKDLSSSQRDSVVYQLRKAGFAAWLRTPSQGDWPYHVHGIAIGDQELSSQARQQVIDYKNGLNGLANHGPDDGPRVAYTEHPQELYMSFYGPEHWDAADWGRFEDKAGWKYNIEDLVAADGSVRDAYKMLQFAHKNGADTEALSKDALAAADAARVSADAAKAASEAVLAALPPA